MKHLILIHGRATKPNEAEKCRLLTKALISGLARVDKFVAQAVEEEKVKLSFAYYGDINNRLMVEACRKSTENMDWNASDGTWYEKDFSYDADLNKLLARPSSDLIAENYRALLREVRDVRAYDDLARAISPVMNVVGLTDKIITKMLPDMGAYLTHRVTGSAIRERLQAPLKKALEGGDEVALVAHSMGCIVSYDVLWKFSRMSEYKSIWNRKIALWLTLGNPLGEPAVRQELYDAGEHDDGKYPANISQWVNIGAHDDYVAHDGDMADDFSEMLQTTPQRQKLVDSIEDAERIYNFWAGQDGSNPHKFLGYLNHPAVAERLAKWIRQ